MEIFQYLFLLIFSNRSMYMNLITRRNTPDFAKDTVYRFMKMIQINWIRFTTILSTRIIKDAILPLNSEDRANVLIIDDCQTELQTAGATHIMENIVYNELLVRGYNVDVGIVDVFAKNSEGKRVHKQLEVDFVVNQGSQRYYIQVAYDMTSEEKQTQELNSLRNIPDSFKKIIIVNGTKKPWRNEEGFVIMGMKYFLLNADSLEF